MSDAAPVEYSKLGIIRVTGSDAGHFLRAQLSNDVLRLGSDRHFLAAWCDAKGRTQLIVRVIATGDAYLLLLPRALIGASLQRLRMFVLRLDVELVDASEDYRIDGLCNDANIPPINRTDINRGQFWLGVPGSKAHSKRALVLTPAGQDAPPGAVPADSSEWALSDIDAGVAQVTPATQGEFVPQMLNLHWLLAVDFDKGCYPGQEVIARLQHRGRLTRRVFRLAWQQRCPAPGEPVHSHAGVSGMVVQAAGTDKGRLLAVVRVDAAAGERLWTQDGHPLEVCDLPYATPD